MSMFSGGELGSLPGAGSILFVGFIVGLLLGLLVFIGGVFYAKWYILPERLCEQTYHTECAWQMAPVQEQ